MFVIHENDWHKSHSDLSKFMIAKFAQLVDRSEVITNHHSSTNGLILLEELYAVSLISLKRWKNSGRLQELLKESIDNRLKSSVTSDLIINKYFRPAKEDVLLWGSQKLDIQLANKINQGALIHTSSIRPLYLKYIQKELSEVEFSSHHFVTESNKIELLLNMLVPQLVYDGHSLAFLQSLPLELIQLEREKLIYYLFNYFSYTSEKKYICFLPQTEQLVHNSLLGLLTPKFFKKVSNTTMSQENTGDIDDEKAESRKIAEETSDKLGDQKEIPKDISDKMAVQLIGNEDTKNEELVPGDGYTIEIVGKDPFSSLRNHVTVAYRKYSLEYPDADPSKLLNPFWDNPYYFDTNKKEYVRFNFEKTNDPLIPAYRTNTLSQSLAKHEVFLDAFKFENLYMFEEAIYFYNLARNVPSVENSYILLWTALEALMGLRSEKADIEVVKSNVAQSLALGAVGRRLVAFLERTIEAININQWSLNIPSIPTYSDIGLCENFLWATDKSVAKTENDPFKVLKNDPLLCKKYLEVNEKWNRVEDLLECYDKNAVEKYPRMK